MPAVSSAIRGELRSIVGDAGLVAEEHMRTYLADATEAQGLNGHADAVVLPSSADEVSAVMHWCYERGVPLVPRGGGTGYAGGCVPFGGVVVATDRLDKVRSVDPLLWRTEVEAGVTTRRVQRLAAENGLYFPVDPGASEQSHIGGNVATNAGGPHTFKYGVTGAWVTRVEAVLPPGRIVEFGSRARKDVAGYDLRSLLVGSEGTLGVITAVDLKLIPAVEQRFPVVGFYETVEQGCGALTAAMASGTVPAALEYLDRGAITIAAGGFPAAVPAGAALMLIAEADGAAAEAQAGRDQLIEAMSADALDLLAPHDRLSIEALWRWREGVGLLADTWLGGKMSEDVAVPLEHLGAMIEVTERLGAEHGLATCSWGHAGDGNLHSTFMFDRRDADARRTAEAAIGGLFDAAIGFGGTVSGEHGLGAVKAGQLRRQWNSEAVRTHREIKRLFDPENLLNPGKKEP